ncbi:MAG: M81 family metallopeptidase [Candidatus Latescibacteria bacterium]|jgi:microcystin degradation protein MlrC|nr:M81 family metallopeptidase [Candidatus Latescibacterota bacterium]
MKWIIGAFAHETNTFSTVPTDLESFRAQTYLQGEEVAEVQRGTETVVGGFLDVLEQRGDEVVYTVSSHATPSGLVTREAFDTIGGQIVEGIAANRDADGILLALHGAMVVEGIDDGEGHLLGLIREVIGDEMPLVVVLDLHSHITEELVDRASMLIGYQKYPHTDMGERGREAAQMIVRIAKGEVTPVVSLNKPPMIPVCGTCHTEGGLYKEMWEVALRSDRPEGILSTSLFAGFSYADIPPMGHAIVVYADGDMDVAKTEADQMAQMAWDRRAEFLYTPTSVPDAIRQALAVEGQPVVIADIADNPGGGGSNDGVEILRELITQGVTRAALATIYDPKVVEEAIEVGVGNMLTTSLGAKTDDFHGQAMDVTGCVRSIWDGHFTYKGPMSRGASASLGTCAVLDIGGILVIVSSKRIQSRDPEMFRAAGVDPMDQKILVVKSAVHFRAGFNPIAADIIIADAPGLTALNLSQFDFKRIQRPLYPIDL